MLLPGRDTFDPQYRFGFNGKENDLDFRGIGVIGDYGMRMYNARLARFQSVDPLTSKYPFYSPFHFAGNNPIKFIDLDGLEPADPGKFEGQNGKTNEIIGTGPGGFGKMEKIWFYHMGSKEYGTKRGWYNAEDYQKVLKPIAKDLAAYQGLLSAAANNGINKNWTKEEKADVVNTKLGRFVGNGLSDEAASNLVAASSQYASDRNFGVTGTITPSTVNVEDALLVGEFLKLGFKAFTALVAEREFAINGFKNAISPFKGGELTNAGRAVTKHPEYFGFESTEILRKVYRSPSELNSLGSSAVKDILRNGVRTTGAGGRYPNGWVTYTLPNGNGASWSVDGIFIGFRGVK